jgi:hypothetical protein
LNTLVSPYAIDPNPAQMHVRIEALPPATLTLAFSTITKDTALSGTITEGTGVSQVVLDTTKASATVAEVGIMRQFTKLEERTNMLGQAGLLEQAVVDGGKMCREKFETDCQAQFANASTSAGTSGSAFKLADVGSALAQHTVNKSIGQLYAVLPATAAKQLRNEVLGSGATWLATGAGNDLLQRTNVDGFMGEILGVPHFVSASLAGTSGADSIGVYGVDGQIAGQEENAPTGCALAWYPEVATWSNPTFSGGTQIAITMAYGLVEIVDFGYVKVTTIT